MKKSILILALTILTFVAKSQFNITPGFIINSTNTYTNTGFYGGISQEQFVQSKNLDSLTYNTTQLQFTYRYDTLILNKIYDTIKVHMTLVLCPFNSTTITINGISTAINNYTNAVNIFEYNQIITDTNQLNYIVCTKDAVSSYTQRTTLKNYNIELIDNSAVSVKELNNSINDLNVYPNPTVNDFKIKFNSTNHKALVQIYDIQGNLVLENNDERNIGQNILDINTNLTSGMYFVKVGNKMIKLIKTN